MGRPDGALGAMRETLFSEHAITTAAARPRRPADFVDRSVVVAAAVGGRLDDVLALVPFAREVTLVHADAADDAAAGRAIRAAAAVQLLRLVEGVLAAVERDGEQLRAVHVTTARGPLRLVADALLTPADVVPFEE